jgi:hypothetical protein
MCQSDLPIEQQANDDEVFFEQRLLRNTGTNSRIVLPAFSTPRSVHPVSAEVKSAAGKS